MKKSLIISLLCVVLFFTVIYFIATSPIKNDKLNCQYKNFSHKIICVQIGDVVPKWYQIDGIENFFDIPVLSMNLIFKKSENEYISMSMTDKIFIESCSRKFIYTLEDQSLLDYIKFKNFVTGTQYNNYGSRILFCSDKNLDDDICKNLKKYSNK